MDYSQIIIKPLVTEKSHLQKELTVPKHAFIVNKKATKLQIKQAFEAIFQIKPIAVNTLLRKPKPTRFTNSKKRGYSKLTKIAYITLPKGIDLDLDGSNEKNNDK